MDSIKDVVMKVVGGIASKKPDQHDKIERIWQNLLTKQELKHTKLLGVNKKTLSICIDSPAWMHQMRLRRTKILKQLKEDIPEIEDIRFKIGTIE